MLLSNYAGIYLGDARFNPIFAELDRRSAVVFIHPNIFTGNAIPSGENAGSPVPTLPSFMLEFVFDTTRAAANFVLSGTLQKYSHLRIILSHAGGTIPFVAQKIVAGALAKDFPSRITGGQVAQPREQIEAIRQAIAGDVLSQLQSLYYDTALSANRHAFSALRELVPASRIVLGTDYPFAPESETGSAPARLAALPGLDEQELRAIEGENALNFFPRLR